MDTPEVPRGTKLIPVMGHTATWLVARRMSGTAHRVGFITSRHDGTWVARLGLKDDAVADGRGNKVFKTHTAAVNRLVAIDKGAKA